MDDNLVRSGYLRLTRQMHNSLLDGTDVFVHYQEVGAFYFAHEGQPWTYVEFKNGSGIVVKETPTDIATQLGIV